MNHDDETRGSVTLWIAGIKAGDEQAVEQLWRRYFDELVRVARHRIRSGRRTESDEEDAALSAFRSLCAGAADGRFAQLDRRDDLWRLLVTIALRKISRQSRRENRQKRGAGRVALASDLARQNHDGGDDPLGAFVSPSPPPDLDVLVAEECQRLLGALRDDTLRQIALLRMEGYSGDEIADHLGCNRRTVVRKLDLIRRAWSEDAAS